MSTFTPSMLAKLGPWDPSPAGDFSNYLFNLVYSSTNLCGDAFYTCGKLLNLVFFVGFLTVIFIIAKRYMNYWIAFAFTILAGLSPLSVYTSMFLPETMYFFFLSLVFAARFESCRYLRLEGLGNSRSPYWYYIAGEATRLAVCYCYRYLLGCTRLNQCKASLWSIAEGNRGNLSWCNPWSRNYRSPSSRT